MTIHIGLTIFVLLISLIANSEPSTSKNPPCQKVIYFLPQTHGPDIAFKDLDLKQSDRLQVADSQLRIYNYLKHHTDGPVFNEETISQEFSNIGRKRKAGEFSNDQLQLLEAVLGIDFKLAANLPQFSSDLTLEQSDFLVQFGAPKLLLLNGLIERTYPVIKESDRQRVFDPINRFINSDKFQPYAQSYPPEIASLVYGERERLALLEIRQFFETHPNVSRVYVIYGADHNFSFYPNLFPPECIVVPDEFQQFWTGRLRTGPLGFEQIR